MKTKIKLALIGIVTIATLIFLGSCKKKTVEPIDNLKREITLVPSVNKSSNYYWINPPQAINQSNSNGNPSETTITVNVGDTILVRIIKTSQDLNPGCKVFKDGVEQNWDSFGPNITDFSARYIVKN